jgi:hypothetical protein
MPRRSGMDVARRMRQYSRMQRPRTVIIAVAVLVGLGLITLVGNVFLLSLVNDGANRGRSVASIVYELFYGQILLSPLHIISGIFLWSGRSWARHLAIAVCSVNIVGGILGLVSGSVSQSLTGIVVNIVLIRLLVYPPVVEWCRR